MTLNLRFLLSCSAVLLLITGACDSYQQDVYEEFIVVEGYAVAGRPLPDIHVSVTTPVDEVYDPSAAALSDASVQIVLLDESENELEVFEYIFSGMSGGAYRAINQTHRVLPAHTYRLDINFNNRPEVIGAQTTIPETFEIVTDVADSYIYQSINQLEISILGTTNRTVQQAYEFSAIANEPVVENLTPFYRAMYDDDNLMLNDVRINSSGLINEGNFDVHPNGTITLRFPWLGVAFFGENRVVINLVDTNLYTLIRSQEAQLGGSTLSPGEIPNINFNIEGGIGIFGSMSTDTISTSFLRP